MAGEPTAAWQAWQVEHGARENSGMTPGGRDALDPVPDSATGSSRPSLLPRRVPVTGTCGDCALMADRWR